MKKFLLRSTVFITSVSLVICSVVLSAPAGIRLRVLGTYATGLFNQSAAEIAAHDPQTQRLFVVNAAASTIDVLSIANPSSPQFLFSIDVTAFGRQANSVDVYDGVIAVAVEANVLTDNGRVVFFNADGQYLNDVTVGALPDMLTFTPNGEKLLVANEGEPNAAYTVDPPGSVSIIDLRAGIAGATVRTADFTSFNSSVLDPSIRIFGPNASVAQDLEPEYIAVSHNSKTAWVTLQENNAVGVLDLDTGRFTRLIGLGFKDHNQPGRGLDASDRDEAINIRNWPVFGMYQPDSIAVMKFQNESFLITANEGDAREYLGTPGFVEEARVNSLLLDPLAFADSAFLKSNANLGRLTVTKANGDVDGDGDFDELYVFGARSFSIWTAHGVQIFDSGDSIEQITASAFPLFFNANSTNNLRDDRSDNKGPEPEGVAIGKVGGNTYAFIGLERIGGVIVYDVTNPFSPFFVEYVNNRNFSVLPSTGGAGDLGPEGLLFISDENSPTLTPLLIVANEISGTATIYEIKQTK